MKEEIQEMDTKLRILRISRNWSQEYVAAQLGITQPAYAKLEAGQTKLTIDRAVKLAGLYEIDPEYFFSTALYTNYFNGENSRSINNTNTYNEISKDIFDKILIMKDQLIDEKNEQIRLLKAELEESKKDREQISNLLKLLTSKLK